MISACADSETKCNCVTFDGSEVEVFLGKLELTGAECTEVPELVPNREFLRCSEANSRSIVGPYADVPTTAIPRWPDGESRDWSNLVNLAAGRP